MRMTCNGLEFYEFLSEEFSTWGISKLTIVNTTREKQGLLDNLYFNSLQSVFPYASLSSTFVLFEW